MRDGRGRRRDLSNQTRRARRILVFCALAGLIGAVLSRPITNAVLTSPVGGFLSLGAFDFLERWGPLCIVGTFALLALAIQVLVTPFVGRDPSTLGYAGQVWLSGLIDGGVLIGNLLFMVAAGLASCIYFIGYQTPPDGADIFSFGAFRWKWFIFAVFGSMCEWFCDLRGFGEILLVFVITVVVVGFISFFLRLLNMDFVYQFVIVSEIE